MVMATGSHVEPRDGRRPPMRLGGSRALAAIALAGVTLLPAAAPAVTVRRRFEPTDLALEDTGTLSLDAQFGFLSGQDADRVELPDYEVALGLLSWLELGADGAAAVVDTNGGARRFDHVEQDNLWLHVKLGALDVKLDLLEGDADPALALGVQVGPKVPLAPGAQGIGIEGLFLAGVHRRGTLLALNLGGLLDPRVDGSRAAGIEGGIDFSQDLDADGRWSFVADLGGVAFRSKDDDQLTASAGIAFDPWDWLEVSLVGLGGFLDGGDRWGVLLGVSPTFRLWR